MSKSYGSQSKGDLLRFLPEQLTVVKKRGHDLFDENAFLSYKEDLVESILAYGVLDPVKFRENGRREDGSLILEVVDGRKRVLATIEANKRRAADGREPILIPALPHRLAGDAKIAQAILITSNELRYPDPPSTRANKAARLEAAGETVENIALAFGISVTETKHLLSLAGLDAKSKAAIDAGTLPLHTAKKLEKLPSETRGKMVEEASASPEGKKRAAHKIARAAEKRTAPARSYVRNVRTKKDIEAALEELRDPGNGAKLEKAFADVDPRIAARNVVEWVLGSREDWR